MAYCDWSGSNDLLTKYHAHEWGVPVHDDRKQFEFLMMEVMQCGLNWNIVLQKREIFEACFDGFDQYLWRWSDGKTLLYHSHEKGWIPASNGLSEKISRDIKKRGFKYIGSITVYSHLQACGIINDHGEGCLCFARINSAYPTVQSSTASRRLGCCMRMQNITTPCSSERMNTALSVIRRSATSIQRHGAGQYRYSELNDARSP